MLRATWAAKWYLILGLLAFLILLVINTPLHFVWQYVQPATKGLPVRISAPVGTVWSGDVRLDTPQSGAINAHWNLDPFSLVTGSLNLAINAEGEKLRLSGRAVADGLYSGGVPDRIILEDVSGFLDAAALSPYLMSMQTSLTGDFTLNKFSADLSLGEKNLNSASGQLVYSGGRAQVPVQRQRISTELPMLVATVATAGDKFVVPVTTEDGEQIGQLFLQKDGWGGVSVLKRALDIAGQPWPDKQATPDTVVFEVSQKIL